MSENKRIQFIDLAVQQQHIRSSLDKRIAAVLYRNEYIMGPEVRELEERLQEYTGVAHCITVADGTMALLLALMALDIRPGDEVITTPFTFVATASMVTFLQAKPVFVDIDPQTCNIDPNKIEAAITPYTKAIIPVSLYGQCADLDAINTIAKRHGLAVIEDGAQSFGATYKGKRSCGLTTVGCTSFFPSKPLGCYGDGGACFTNDTELARKISQIRVHGQDRRYHHAILGINGRLDTLQAAVLLAKLEVFNEEVRLRAEIGQRYTELLKDVVKVPHIETYNTSVFAQYTIQVDRREKLREELSRAGVPTAVHYPIPLHLQPVFNCLKLAPGTFPIAELAAQKVLSLPMSAYLTMEEQVFIVDRLKECVNNENTADT